MNTVHGNLKDHSCQSQVTYFDATYIVKETYSKYVTDIIMIKIIER